jgi:hypothetical protein
MRRTLLEQFSRAPRLGVEMTTHPIICGACARSFRVEMSVRYYKVICSHCQNVCIDAPHGVEFSMAGGYLSVICRSPSGQVPLLYGLETTGPKADDPVILDASTL